MHRDAISGVPKQTDQAVSHIERRGIGKRKTKNIARRNVFIATQNIRDTQAEQLGLPGSRPRNNHDGAGNLVDRFLLLFIKELVALVERAGDSGHAHSLPRFYPQENPRPKCPHVAVAAQSTSLSFSNARIPLVERSYPSIFICFPSTSATAITGS